MLLSETPGTIVLPTSEIGRYMLFTASLSSTRQPDDCELSIRASANISENLNNAISAIRPYDGWVWIIGDDHVWQSDCLMKLLDIMDENPEIDILVPLVAKRNPPWIIVVYHEIGVYEDGVPKWEHFKWEEIPPSGVFEVDGAGSAGMLIRRSVIEDMGSPWFESTDGRIINEDLTFCKKARALGWQIFATSDVVMGHLGIYNVRPLYKDNRWGALTEFSTPEDKYRHIFMPVEYARD